MTDDDSADLASRIGRQLGRYGDLYPSAERRLREILHSPDPRIRRRVAHLTEILGRRSEERRERLVQRYGLTAAESRVALWLADGGELASYATAAAVSLGTVRAQLKAVFAKTGVNRQAALVRLVQAPF